MVSGHACVRVQKMAIPLTQNGHEVHLIARAMPWGFENYRTFFYAEGRNHYLDAIKVLSKSVDIFHCHNEPSWFVSAVKEVCDIPVVLDVHDSYLARSTPEQVSKLQEEGKLVHRVYVEERNNFKLADALVFPGDDFGEIVRNEFNLTQPHITLPSYCPEILYQYNCKPWMGGILYEGKVNLRSEIEKGGRNFGFEYCIYEDLAKKFHEHGVDFHIYATRKDEKFMAVYKDISFVHNGYPIHELLSRITAHDWGLVGNIFPTQEWKVAYPNKMFEYIAAQVPVVCMNADSSSRFVEENGVGITVGSVEELCDRWREHESVRNTLIRKRRQWMMEQHIHKLEELYEAIL